MSHAVIIADYDPGTLTGFYVVLLTAAVVLICLAVSGILFCLKFRRTAIASVILAGIGLLIGVIAAFLVIWLSQRGVVHLL